MDWLPLMKLKGGAVTAARVWWEGKKISGAARLMGTKKTEKKRSQINDFPTKNLGGGIYWERQPHNQLKGIDRRIGSGGIKRESAGISRVSLQKMNLGA